MDGLATELRTAFNERDIDAFRALLAEGARWGEDPEHPTFCHNRNDIIAHLKQLLDEGVRATMVDTTTGLLGVACVLDVEWPEPETWRPDRQSIYQTYMVTDGVITEIHSHEDHAAAVAAISR